MSVALLLLSAVLFSVYPLLASIGLERNDPIIFAGVMHACCAVFALGCGGWLLKKKYGRRVKFAGVFRLDKAARVNVLVTAVASAVNHSCLMYALLKTSKMGTVVIYETWPIIAVWLTPLLIVKGWEQVRRMDYLFGLLAVAGAAFVISADARNFILHFDVGALKSIDPDRLLGYGLAFAGSVGVSISTVLRRRVTSSFRDKYDDDLLLSTYLSSGVTRLASLPVYAIIYFLVSRHSGKTFTLSDLPLAAFTGIAVHLMGSVCYVFSLLKNPNPSIPVPDYLSPIMAMAWLYFAGYAGMTDFTVIGALFVITANLLVTVRAEDGFAYTASIMTLLLGGAYCYFTVGDHLDNFYDAISVSAVFYAILIAFAWDRVLERIKHEEGLMLDIAYGIEDLKLEHRKNDASLIRKLIADIRTVLTTTDRALIGATYHKLLKTREKLGLDKGVSEIYHRLDSLILSKTKDIMLSEVVLLWLIGGITFFGILGYRPPGIWPDMMGFIMAGAIIFIFFAIFDQMKARNKKFLSGTQDSLCLFSEDLFQSRNEYKLVTVLLIAIMLAVFYGLFVYKYKMLGPLPPS